MCTDFFEAENMKKIVNACLVSLLFLFSACEYGNKNVFYYGNSVKKRASEIKKLNNVETKKSHYKVLVLTDLHFGVAKAGDPTIAFFKWFDSLTDEDLPAFCLSLGDQIDRGYTDEMVLYKDFMNKIEKRNVKVYNVVGNHDLYNSGWDVWKANCYPNTSFYKFETEKLSWYGIDSGTATLGNEQFNVLENEFRNDKKPKIVFTHYPIYTNTFLFCMEDTTERNRLIQLYEDNNVKCSLGGHIHKYEVTKLLDYEIITFPSFRYCKQWGILDIDEDNENIKFSIVSGL